MNISEFFKFTLSLTLALTFTQPGFAHGQEAEVVWIDNSPDGGQVLWSELLEDDVWSEPTIIYKTKNPLTSPALGTDHYGNKLLIWTEQRRTKTILRSGKTQSYLATKVPKTSRPLLCLTAAIPHGYFGLQRAPN